MMAKLPAPIQAELVYESRWHAFWHILRGFPRIRVSVQRKGSGDLKVEIMRGSVLGDLIADGKAKLGGARAELARLEAEWGDG